MEPNWKPLKKMLDKKRRGGDSREPLRRLLYRTEAHGFTKGGHSPHTN